MSTALLSSHKKPLMLPCLALFCMTQSVAQAATIDTTTDYNQWLGDVGGASVINTTSNFSSSLTNNGATSLVNLNNGTPNYVESIFINQPITLINSPTYGQVLYSGQPSITLTSAGIGAFGFQVEPAFPGIPSSPITTTVTLSNNQTFSATLPTTANASQFFGYYGTGVNSITITSNQPITLSNFVDPSEQKIMQNTVTTSRGGTVSQDGHYTSMTAQFTPNGGLTLAQAATDLNLATFDWQQEIMIPSPSPYRANSAPNTPLVGALPDPVAGGYTYEKTPDNAYPYYFDVKGGSTKGNQNELQDFETNNNSTLNFIDTPADTCFTGGNGHNCGGTTVDPATNPLRFITALVGVNPDLTPGRVFAAFNWTDNFNGTSAGGASLKNLALADIDSGTGGVTLLSETDYSVSATPLPPSLPLFGSAFLGLVAFSSYKKIRRTTQDQLTEKKE